MAAPTEAILSAEKRLMMKFMNMGVGRADGEERLLMCCIVSGLLATVSSSRGSLNKAPPGGMVRYEPASQGGK